MPLHLLGHRPGLAVASSLVNSLGCGYDEGGIGWLSRKPFGHERMSVDWWARGLGISGIVLGAGGTLWRCFEWWIAGRARLKVIASAGRVQWSPDLFGILYGEGVEESSVIVEAINTSRRVIVVESVGFLDRSGKAHYYLKPLPGGHLPASLSPGERVSGWGDPKTFVQALRSGAQLIPFCKEVEGRVHKGKEAESFRRFKRRAREATDA